MVVSVGVDVSKDKHDCFILSSEGEVLADVFTIPNNLDGFRFLLQRPTYVLNPLRTNIYRKSLSLRKTKTDRVDARTIASMLLSDAGLKPYTNTAYHNEELKSLTRYRFDKVKERAKLKSSIARTRLKTLLETASKGHYKRDMALEIRDAARNSIGSWMPAKSLELQHTIRLIRELDDEIAEIEKQIQAIMDELNSPITTIPGIGFRMAAMIFAEVGDFTRFDSPDKLLAYAGMSPSTYQSGQLKNCYPHMEKRGSRYLRYALYNATKYVCHWDPTFAAYLAKKRAEGKHYNVALSHATKKLVRLIFAMEKSRQPYRLVA